MKKRLTLFQIAFIVTLSLILVLPVQAREIKASLGFIPVLSESPEKGILVNLIKAMDDIYTDGTITIDVYPTARSIQNIINGSHDFHLPSLRSGMENEEAYPYDNVESLWTSIFVLYTNKTNRILI